MTPVSKNTMKTVTNHNLSTKTTTPFSAGDLLKSHILSTFILPQSNSTQQITVAVHNSLL
jgi:hypothetical protein